jgi:hypothetical protein
MRSAIPEALLKIKKMLHTKAQQPFCLERHEEKKEKVDDNQRRSAMKNKSIRRRETKFFLQWQRTQIWESF